MYFLSITDPQNWLLSAISMAVVFAILIILVAILALFSLVANKSTAKSTKVAKNSATPSQELKNANEEDKAAVAAAVYLYFEERNNTENRVLTIVPSQSAWGAQLNPRL